MTVTVLQHEGNGYCVSLEQILKNHGIVLVVQACPKVGEQLYGYPEIEMSYPLAEEKKAIRTYKRYVKKYCTQKGE